MTIVNMVGGSGGIEQIISTLGIIETDKVQSAPSSGVTSITRIILDSFLKVGYSDEGTMNTIQGPTYSSKTLNCYRASVSAITSVSFSSTASFPITVRDILTNLGKTSVSFKCEGLVGWGFLLDVANYPLNKIYSPLTNGFPTYTFDITITQSSASITTSGMSINYKTSEYNTQDLRLVIVPTSVYDFSFS